MRYLPFIFILFFACNDTERPTFDTKALVDLFQAEQVEADYFSLGTDRGHMLLVDIEKSPLVDSGAVDMGNLISTAAYLSYMQLTERKMETEKIRIAVYKKIPGNTEEYSRDFPMDSLDMVSRYYAAFHDRLSALKQGEYQGVLELLDKEKSGPSSDSLFTQIHDNLFARHGSLTNISFAGFDYGKREGTPYLSITGDYDFERGRVPFVYVFSQGDVRIVGFYVAEG